MWQVIAEEDLHCTECFHKIASGTECLSQMPRMMPEHFHRKSFQNFCLSCDNCNQKGKPTCYVRRLNHWYTPTDGVKDTTGCAYCGDLIPKSMRVTVQTLYAWPETDPGSKGTPRSGGNAATSARSAGVASGSAAKRAQSGAWNNLSAETQKQFRTRGLGRGIGPRSPTMARRFYETRVPASIRNQGEEAVKNFMNGKDASHIKSVANKPTWAKRPSNVVLEDSYMNRARGSRNMTRADLNAAEKAGRRAGIRATFRGVAKGGIIAAALEAPIAGLENFFHWRRGRKSLGGATADSAKSAAGAGAVGMGVTAATAGVAKGATMVGVSPTLGPAGVPLAVAGAVLVVGATTYRIFKAANRDLPLDEYRLFFCRDSDCKSRFAQGLTNAALKSPLKASPLRKWLRSVFGLRS